MRRRRRCSRQRRLRLKVGEASVVLPTGSICAVVGCNVVTGSGWRAWLSLGAEHGESSAVAFEAFTNADAGARRDVVQGHGANIGASCSGDMLARNPVVCDGGAPGNNAGRSDCMIKNSRGMIARQNMSSEIVFEEMAGADELKMIGGQAERKVVSGGMAMKCQTEAGNKS